MGTQPGEAPLSFTAALHSYLRVADVQECRLRGLHGLRYWDAVADTHPTQQGDVAFGAELDRVYPRPVQGMDLMATGRRLRISQDAAWSETVVWNPGPELCARLADMPAQAWRQMLCVEAAAIDAPVLVPPGVVARGAAPSAAVAAVFPKRKRLRTGAFAEGPVPLSGAACAATIAPGAGPG